jgi:hypothetical protein
MERKLNELAEVYNNIEIPDELDKIINSAIRRNKKNNFKYSRIWFRNSIFIKSSIATVIIVFVMVIAVNINVSFAQGLYEIPIVGKLAKIITFKEYTFDNETSKGEIVIPHIENNEHKLIADKVNRIIDEKVATLVEEQAILDKEYKQAFLETGGKEENYNKIEITIDYKKCYSDENILSFQINKYQTLAPAYNEDLYYNIDMKTGEEITIKDLLGDDYNNILVKNITNQMKNRIKENPEDFSYDLNVFSDKEYGITIDENRTFYIDEDGNIVITFAKYEVASGSMGVQEFIIENIRNIYKK